MKISENAKAQIRELAKHKKPFLFSISKENSAVLDTPIDDDEPNRFHADTFIYDADCDIETAILNHEKRFSND